jgi:hypothetical protein
MLSTRIEKFNTAAPAILLFVDITAVYGKVLSQPAVIQPYTERFGYDLKSFPRYPNLPVEGSVPYYSNRFHTDEQTSITFAGEHVSHLYNNVPDSCLRTLGVVSYIYTHSVSS